MNAITIALNSPNHWTREMIAQDAHFGSRREAMLIDRENGRDKPLTCGQCGGEAHYKNTIGTQKCIACGSLRLTGPAPEFRVRWS